MRIWSIIIIISIIVLACGGSTDNTQTAKATSKKEVGKRTYNTYCVRCHGMNGDMGSNGAKDLGLSTMTLEERISIIKNGRKLMTPFKSLLNDKKIKDVATYTMKFNQ